MSSTIQEQLDLLDRGVEATYSREELKRKLLSGKRLRIKLGMDPTAPDIHLGHTVVLQKMRQFQDLGHKAILLIGDYTARIGDPTGRDTARPVLDEAAIKSNAETYLQQALKVLDDHPDRLELRYNSEWLSQLSFADVLRITSYITVQQMLQRDMFKKRIAAEREIILTEFMYPLMQAYDSVALEADVELGGTDQTFNNLMGRSLMEKMGMEKQVVLVMPILVGLDGVEKMSKSKGNYVGVTDEPNNMYGKIMSIPDNLMSNYYSLLTTLPTQEITTLTNPAATHPRDAKDQLARSIVAQYHSPAAAEAAAAEFKARFAQGALPADLETHAAPAASMGLLALMVHVGFAASNGEARRLVGQSAVSIDDARASDPNATVTLETPIILKVGKRRVCRVTGPGG